MTTKPTLFAHISGSLKDWVASLQQRFFLLDEWQQEEEKKPNFRYPPADTSSQDQEMERLVKAIEETRNENSLRYQ